MACNIVRRGAGNTLNVLGMPLRFLCDAKDTHGAWSLMEEEIGLGLGPAAHRHDWDEAYYMVDGVLDFEIDGKSVRLGRAKMVNLIGSEVDDYAKSLKAPGASVHLYGKGEGRPGRKMGHVTTIVP